MDTKNATINATGWIFSTKTGRATWAPEAIKASIRATGNSRTPTKKARAELDAASSIIQCENYVKQLTGAEAAFITSSNAGAMMLIMNEFARDREAILSRGEGIDVSNRFNIFDLANAAGVKLIEVGSTNKTHISDYRRAISENTGMILKMQRLNYRVEGDSLSIGPAQLVSLANKENALRRKSTTYDNRNHPFEVVVYANQGTGILDNPAPSGFQRELTVREYLEAGCDLVSCSCDLLLGGPRAGIIAGSKRCISSLVRNPLSYVLKPSKSTSAALARTLELYTLGMEGALQIPTCRMLMQSIEALKARAEALENMLNLELPTNCATTRTMRSNIVAGDDVLPLLKMDTYLVMISPIKGDASDLKNYLQNDTDPNVLTQAKDGCVAFDMRTLKDSEIMPIVAAVKSYFTSI